MDNQYLLDQIALLTKQVKDLSDLVNDNYKKLRRNIDDVDATSSADTFTGSQIQRKKLLIQNEICVGDHDEVAKMSVVGGIWRIWAGKADPATAPFRVDKDGNMVATSVTLTGYVAAGGAAADINANTTTINGGKITTNTIAASAIVTGSLVVGTNVGLGTAQTAGQVTTIIGNTVTTGYVNALSVTAGSVAAENITGTYITGKTLRTASSGTRIVIDGAANEIDIYNGSTLRAVGYQNGWSYYNSSGTLVGNLYADSNNFLLKGAQTTSDIFLSRGSAATVTMGTGSTPELTWDGDDFYPLADGTKGLGTSGYHWSVCYADYVYGDGFISMGDYIRSGTYLKADTYLDVDGGHISINGNGFMRLKSMSGTTAAGLSGIQNGCMYYRSDVGDIRVYVGGAWHSINVT